MSGRGNNRGNNRGRGRGRSHAPSSPEIVEAPAVESLDVDFAPPDTNQTERTRKPRPQLKSPEDLRRTMEIVKRSIVMVIDNLEENDNEASLKRSVMIAIKHLKQIEGML
jgi:hypothetical protein